MLTIRVAVFELLFLIENAFLICTDKPVELHKVKIGRCRLCGVVAKE